MNDEPKDNIVDLPARREPAIMLAEEPQEGVLARFPGLSQKRFTEDQAKTLQQPIPPNDLDILPTGEIYLSQVQYRRILNDAFGPGGWGLVPTGEFYQDGKTLCREYSLFAEGRFISSAIGEADFQPNNPRHSKATAAESLKSNALMRCCKDLGIASECWDKRSNAVWIKANAVAVWCKAHPKSRETGTKKLWRRKDSPRFEYPWVEEGTPTTATDSDDDPLGDAFGPEDVPAVDVRGDTYPGESLDLGELAQEAREPIHGSAPVSGEIAVLGATQATKPATPARPRVSEENRRFCTEMKKQKMRIGKAAYYKVIGEDFGFSHSWEVLDRNTQTGIWNALKALPDEAKP